MKGVSAPAVALRQLLSRSHSAFVRTVSLLSVLGIAIGVASLLLVQAFAVGFTETIRRNLVAFHPPVIVYAPGGYPLGSDDLDLVRTVAEDCEGASGISASLERTAVASGNGGSISGVMVRGVEWQSECAITGLRSLTGLDELESGVVLGPGLAERLRLRERDRIRVASTMGVQLSGAGRALLDTIVDLQVVRVVDFGLDEFNSSLVLMDIEDARSLFRSSGMPGMATSAGVGVGEGSDPAEVAARLSEDLERVYVSEGYDLFMAAEAFLSRHSNLFQALGLERMAMTIVLALITVVALLNLSSALTMIALEHQRDTGVMRAFGATPAFVFRLSLSQGLLISGSGVLLGVLLALLGAALAGSSVLAVRLEASVYWVDRLPVILRPAWFAIIGGGTLAAGLLSSLIPALRSISMTPSEAVRYE